MAEDFNPQIGSSLDEIRKQAARVAAAAEEMSAANRAAQRQGYQPSRKDIERETARARAQEVAYDRPLTQAQQARLEAEVEAGRATRRDADAAGRRAAATEKTVRAAEADAASSTRAAEEHRAAQARLKALEDEYAAAVKAKLSAAQRALLSEVVAHPNDRAMPLRNTRTAESLAKRGLIEIDRSSTRPQMYATEAGRGVEDPSRIIEDAHQQRQYIARLGEQIAAEEVKQLAAEKRITAAKEIQAGEQGAVARTRAAQPSAPSAARVNPALTRYIEAEQNAEKAYWAERARKVLADRQAAGRLQEWERTALQGQLAQVPDVNPRKVKEAQDAARAARAEAGMVGGRPTIGQAQAGYGPGRQGSRNVESRGDVLAKRLEKAAAESDRFTATMYRSGQQQERLFGQSAPAAKPSTVPAVEAGKQDAAEKKITAGKEAAARAEAERLSAIRRAQREDAARTRRQSAAAEREAQARELNARRLEADAATQRLAERYSVRKQGKSYIVADPSGQRAEGTGFMRTREAAEARRAEIVSLERSVLPENSRYAAALRAASPQVHELAAKLAQAGAATANLAAAETEAATVARGVRQYARRAGPELRPGPEATVLTREQAAEQAKQLAVEQRITAAKEEEAAAAARRARVEAVRAAPSVGPGATAPLTRAQAAVVGLANADAELEQAKRRYAAAIKSKTASEGDRVEALSAREAAKLRQQAANVELKAVQNLAKVQAEAAAATANLAAAETAAANAARSQALVITRRMADPNWTGGPPPQQPPPGRDLVPYGGTSLAVRERYYSRWGAPEQPPPRQIGGPPTIGPGDVQRALPPVRIAGLLGPGGPGRRRLYVDRNGTVVERLSELIPQPRRFVSGPATTDVNASVREAANAKLRENYDWRWMASGQPDLPPSGYRSPTAEVFQQGAGGFERARGPAAPPAGPSAADIRNTQTMSRLQETVGSGYQRNTAYLNAYSNAYRKHGYLTSEFIEAAARGEASYREWGAQIAGTAAKFAGWTAVSIPVFATLGAIREIGKGAIASADGVNQLQRVIDTPRKPGQSLDQANEAFSQRAQGDFRTLSSDYNVPIETASEAVYIAGQRFHNYSDAVLAARSALDAFKTAGLPVDEGMRQLNSTTQAFGLQAEQVAGVLDLVNAAQNRFGATTPDTIAGLARAGGAFRNAGGDVEGLITLLTAGRVAAGRTGAEMGTVIQRSVGYVRRPSNEASLRGFGINNQLPFYRPEDKGPSILGEAVKVTRQLQESGRSNDIRSLATALSSPQFASTFEPILLQAASGNDQLLKTIVEGIRKEAPGSTKRELETIKGSPGQIFAAFGNELQRFGSNLSTSGVVDYAVKLAQGFTLLGKSVNTVGEGFSALPSPLRDLTLALAVARGGQLVARRLGVGENQGGLRGRLFGRSDEAQAALLTKQALRENAEALRADTQGFAGRARSAYLRHDVNRDLLKEAQDREARVPGSVRPERMAALVEAEAQSGQLARSMENERRVLDKLARTQATVEEQAAEAARQGKSVQFARESGTYLAPGIHRPTDRPPGILTGGGIPGQFGLGAAARQARADQAFIGPLTKAQAEAAKSQGRFSDAISGLAFGAGAAGRDITRTGSAVGSAFRRVGTGALGFLGPWGLAIGALEGGIWALDYFKKRAKEKADELAAIQTPTYTPGQRTKQAQSAQDIVNEERANAVGNARAGQRSGGRGASGRATSSVDVAAAADAQLANNERYQTALTRLREIQSQQRGNRSAARTGQPRQGLTRVDIEKEIQELDAAYKNKEIQKAEFLAGMDRVIEETLPGNTKNLRNSTRRFLRRTARSRQDATRPVGDIATQALLNFDLVDPAQYTKDLELLDKIAASPAAAARDLHERFLKHSALALRSANSTTPQGKVDYQTQLQALTDSAKPIADELDRNLSVAHTPAQRSSAYSRYFRRTRALDDDLKAKLKIATQDRVDAQRRLAEANKDVASATNLPEHRVAVGRRDFWKKKVASAKNVEAALKTLLGDFLADIAAAMGQMTEQSSTDALDSQLATIDANTALAVANAGNNEAGRAAAKMQGYQQTLAALKSTKNVDPNRITQTNADIRELQNENAQREKQAAEDAKQRAEERRRAAEELLRAQYNLRSSLTDDPVKLAQLKVDEANAVLRKGGFTTKADKLNAQADRNTALRDKQSTINDRKLENLDYQHDIGKLSDQAFLSALERQLLSLKKGTEMYRNLRMRIGRFKHDMEQQSDFSDLQIGNIKLPTVYDVRRLARTATRGVAVNNNNQIVVQVARGVDMADVGSALERITGASVNSGLRSAGMV